MFHPSTRFVAVVTISLQFFSGEKREGRAHKMVEELLSTTRPRGA